MDFVEPSLQFAESFLEALREFPFHPVPGAHDFRWEVPMEEYIARLKNHAGGIGLPDGHVPASTYWLVEEGAVIGHANIRHRLTPSLERRGGHIGYAVRPTKQGRGYGTTILALALRQARTLGIDRVLVTCDKTNVASRRVIEKNSGILQDQIHMEGQSVPILRFWIDNRPASSH